MPRSHGMCGVFYMLVTVKVSCGSHDYLYMWLGTNVLVHEPFGAKVNCMYMYLPTLYSTIVLLIHSTV